MKPRIFLEFIMELLENSIVVTLLSLAFFYTLTIFLCKHISTTFNLPHLSPLTFYPVEMNFLGTVLESFQKISSPQLISQNE